MCWFEKKFVFLSMFYIYYSLPYRRMSLSISIIDFIGSVIPVEVRINFKVINVKKQIAQEEGFDSSFFELTFEGNIMEEHKLLGDYGICECCELVMTSSKKGNAIKFLKEKDITEDEFLKQVSLQSDLSTYFIDAGVNVNSITADGRSALHLSTDLTFIKYLISQDDVNINVRDSDGFTPLVDCFNPIRGTNSLPEKAKLLIRNGADVNATTTTGRVALHFAKDESTVELLLQNGASPNVQDALGYAPIHCCQKHPNIASHLIQFGADVDTRRNNWSTALHYGTNTTFTRLLLENNANPNIKTKCGETPLHCCLKMDVADLLIKYGADTSIVDNRGQMCPARFRRTP